MSYVETPADFNYPWYLRLMFRLQRRRYGRELEAARLWGAGHRALSSRCP